MRFLYAILFFTFISPYFSQEKTNAPREKTFREELKLNKKRKKEQREKKRVEKLQNKAIKKYHKRLQTKKVRKRMKQTKNKSNLYNDNKSEFFMIKWFKKKTRN